MWEFVNCVILDFTEDELVDRLSEKRNYLVTHILKKYMDFLAKLKAKGIIQPVEFKEIWETANPGDKANKIVHLFIKHRSSMIAIYEAVKEAGNVEVTNCLGDILHKAHSDENIGT